MKKEISREYQKQAKEIREKLNGRPYSMGLDLGVGSIGLSVIALDIDEDGEKYATDIVFATSHIFKSSEGAQDRRLKRGQRNSLRHRANRLKRLWKELSNVELMLPYKEEKDAENTSRLRFSEEILKLDPYQIRYKGLNEKLTKEELGFALYHIANHRGSSSISSDEAVSDDEKELLEKQGNTRNLQSKYGYNTFIEIINQYIKDGGKTYRNTGANPSQPIPVRDIIINETDKLFNKQKEFYPELITEEFIERIKAIMFYENNMIVPESGKCPYFPNEPKLPKGAFINEERRLYEAINNITYDYSYEVDNIIYHKRHQRLNKEEKEAFYSVLRSGKKLNEKNASKILNLDGEVRVIFPGNKKKNELEGFRFKKLESLKCFNDLNESEQNKLIAIFTNSINNQAFCDSANKMFKFSSEELKELSQYMKDLPKGYAPVGETAMIILLPYIRDFGLSYQEAEAKALEEGQLELSYDENYVYDYLPYYGEVVSNKTQELMGKAWHSAFSEIVNSPSFKKPNTNKDEEKFGKIANPVVHQTLNELRKLVNEVIEILEEKPEEITVEVGKEIKVGIEEREKLIREQTNREKENLRIYNEYCKPNQLKKSEIKKFKLFEDQAMKCPYCLTQINVNDIVNNNVDIDHILPKEDYPDSQINNLVIAHKNCNEKKGKKTPYAAFHGNLDLWNKIEQYLEVTPGMVKKKWRFELTDDAYKNFLENKGFLTRFKTDNAYISRVAVQYLQSLFPKEKRLTAVRTIKGGETALLRKAWNLNGITANLARLHFLDIDSSVLKDRTDARHHALDAIVIGYYTYSFKHMINNANNKKISEEELLERIPIPRFYIYDHDLSKDNQKKEFRKYIENFILNDCFISRKVVVDKNGQLLKDTVYSIIAAKNNDLILGTKKSLDNINVALFESTNKKGDKSLEDLLCNNFKMPSWVEEKDKVRIEKLIKRNAEIYKLILSKKEDAEESLINKNKENESIGKKTKPITEKDIIKEAINKSNVKFYWSLTNNKKNKVFVQKEPKDAVNGVAIDTGDNYSLDLYHDENGKLKGEIIRKIQWNDPSYIPEYKKQGFELFERIYPRDILEIDAKDNFGLEKVNLEFLQGIKVPNANINKTLVAIPTFTEVGSSLQIYLDSLSSSNIAQNGSITVPKLQSISARKIKLSSAGLVIYRSRILRDKDVESN